MSIKCPSFNCSKRYGATSFMKFFFSVLVLVSVVSTPGKLSSPLSPEKRLTSPEKSGDRSDRIHVRDPVTAGEFEIALQWYTPDIQGFRGNFINLLAALNSKPISVLASSSQFSQAAWVFLFQVDRKQCLELHEGLKEYIQVSEASLAAQGNVNFLSANLDESKLKKTNNRVIFSDLTFKKKNRVYSGICLMCF